ncbi:MAG: response regulator [Opitutaceae bacterium]
MSTMPITIASAPPFAVGSHPSRPLRILYADDVRELRDLMRMVLTKQGHNVETVDSGAPALTRLSEAQPGFDLLITDHHMPGVNGLELVRQTRESPYSGKIVVFSSEISEEVHEQYRRFAVDAILPKPIFPSTFCNVLNQLFAEDHAPVSRENPTA